MEHPASFGENKQPISMMSDSSFVILGQGSLPCEDISIISCPVEQDENTPLQPRTFQLNGNSMVNGNVETSIRESNHNSWNIESSLEIQKKLDSLLKENFQLKETLSQNNLAMKQQFNTLVMWQEDVMKTHQTHKQKFTETKELIVNLKEENVELKKQIESLKSNESLTGTELKSNDENILLKKQITDLELKLNNLSKREIELVRKEQEMHKLTQNVLEKLEIAEKTNRQLTIDKEKLQTQQDKLSKSYQDLEIENINIKDRLKVLEKENDDLCQKIYVSPNLAPSVPDISQLSISNNGTENKMTSMSSWMCLENKDGKQVSECKDVDQLKSEVEILRKLLILEQQNSTEKQDSLINVQQQFKSLYADYQQLLEKCNKLTIESSTSTDKLQQQSYIDTVDALNKQLVTKNELLKRREIENEKLKETIGHLQLECEKVAILTAQVEVYQSDFNAERQAREKLAAEKESVAETLREMQRRNRELSEELGKLNPPTNVARTVGDLPNMEQPTQSERKYQCPRCLFRFILLEDCEKHVNICLDIDMAP